MERGLEDYTEGRLKPGKYDRRHRILIRGVELQALKLLAMPESFGLESRIRRYEGKRPIGLYRWDWECLLDAWSLEWADRPQHRRLRRRDIDALKSLYERLRKEYDSVYGEATPSIKTVLSPEWQMGSMRRRTLRRMGVGDRGSQRLCDPTVNRQPQRKVRGRIG